MCLNCVILYLIVNLYPVTLCHVLRMFNIFQNWSLI